MPLALTMALVGFAQTISVGKSLGNKFGYDIDANRELTALGLSNLTSSVSQGYAVSGSLARSALNAAAGARTQLAAIVSAVCVGITTLFFTPLFHYLPQATLAAILIVSSLRLIDTREIRYLFKVKITEGILLVFTFVATLALGIMPGLLLGIVASILLFITLNTRPNTAILGRLPNTNIFRNVQHFPEAETIPGLVILRIDASLYFANAVFLKEKVHEICRPARGGPEGAHPRRERRQRSGFLGRHRPASAVGGVQAEGHRVLHRRRQGAGPRRHEALRPVRRAGRASISFSQSMPQSSDFRTRRVPVNEVG